MKAATLSFISATGLCVAILSVAAVAVVAHPYRARPVPAVLREIAATHGCDPGFAWDDSGRQCFTDDLVYEVDCDTARAAQTVPHVVAVEIRWPNAEVGKVVLIDVADAIGDEWIAYCESDEPEDDPEPMAPASNRRNAGMEN